MPRLRLPDRLFAALHACLPTRLLSTILHRLAQSRRVWVKRFLINVFCRLYEVDLTEAQQPQRECYASFNAFFTRALRSQARPIDSRPDAIVAPVDGRLGTFGPIRDDQILQAKGQAYDLSALLADNPDWDSLFDGGSFATLYLAPHNYHRVHMPLDARLTASLHVPGRLFGVNPMCVRSIARLFTRNERLVTLYDTAVGPMAMILVGAFCVGGIETRWTGPLSPPHHRGAPRQMMPKKPLHLQRGEEMGRFNLGSTVILLFGRNAIQWLPELRVGQPLVLGRALATGIG